MSETTRRGSESTRPWSRTPTRRFSDGLEPATLVMAAWDVLSAAAAKSAGATHLFLSGAALNNVHGYPDRGLVDTGEVAQVITEITTATDLPILVDAEAGAGGLPRATRLFDELARAGTTAMMLEDQVEAGQSKSLDSPGLCDPEIMCERIVLARAIVGDEIAILARTDYLPGMSFEESLERLRMYRDAGADWFIPVFPPSFEALEETAAEFPDKLMVLAASPPISGVMKYAATREELERLNPLAIIATGQYRDAYAALRRVYSMCLRGEWAEVFSERPDPVALDDELGLTRDGMNR